MRWRQKSLTQFTDRLVQLGLLGECSICGSGTKSVNRFPVILSIGGFHHEPGDPQHDPEANVLFMIAVNCSLCGNVQLFDSEHLSPSSDKNIIRGISPEDEAAMEARGELE
jgi:hypothetical protein